MCHSQLTFLFIYFNFLGRLALYKSAQSQTQICENQIIVLGMQP